jgi:tRNA (cmo5U34)-methyltransferase
MRDDIFQGKQTQIVDFAFNQEVVNVFPDMIRRSIPGYETIIPMTGLIAARHVGAAGRIYDLGCSLGASTLAALQQSDAEALEVIGIDSSKAMVEQAQANIRDPRASFVCADVRTAQLEGANAVICNFVLQFIEPTDRLAMLQRIHDALPAGGLLIVSEKVRHDDPRLHEFYDTTHLAWKRANGYSDLEISQKRTALENVMIIDTEPDHQHRMQRAGFSRVDQWYRCLNWASWVAVA